MEQRLGSAIRLVRRRRGLRQSDLARSAGVSTSTVSRIERGHMGPLPFTTTARVAAELDIRLDVVARWRGGELDRLLNAAHSAMHEQVARAFAELPGWQIAPEVSFSIWGERGVVDLLAWHAGRRMLLVIELKTAIVDVQELIATVDRKRRLAAEMAAGRIWGAWDVGTSGAAKSGAANPGTSGASVNGPAKIGTNGPGPSGASANRAQIKGPATSAWVVVADTRTNRARLAAHAAVLRAAFPADGRTVRGWLTDPRSPISALSFLQFASVEKRTSGRGGLQRIRTGGSRGSRAERSEAEHEARGPRRRGGSSAGS
jgi:transcriptional regulator with XRE-family HTH domain